MSQDKSKEESTDDSNSIFNSPNDNRKEGHWQTRYSDPEAKKAIEWEKWYLIILLTIFLILPFTLGILTNGCTLYIPCDYLILKVYGFAWMGGTLGGIIFSMKWLYHSVAKNSWNIDRRLWRIFTPYLSGVLALIIIVLINSKTLLSISELSLNLDKAYGIGFLVGYFSDNAIGKLTELANVLFASKK
jgi:hypothetical protein